MIGLLIIGTVSTVSGQSGTVEGTIRTSGSETPVDFAQILLRDAHRSTTSDEDGAFVLRHIPPGLYSLQVYRIGFLTLEMPVEVSPNDTLRLDLVMRTSVIEHAEVVVEGARSSSQFVDAAMAVEGERLRQHLGTTIAETMKHEPGLSMRSMGPAPARPVLRGLGGERLLVLEDGGRTGDLSQTSSDHALVVDPLTADRIEVVRGPASLIYGPNTLGGAVNVVHDYIPSARPDRIRLTLTSQTQTVNDGLAAGAAVRGPLAAGTAFQVEGAYRTAGDLRTPEGRLANTDLTTLTGSAGLSIVRHWGYMGVSGSLYDSGYGIPGGFVGAHPNGVSIDLSRQHLQGRAEFVSPLPGIQRLQLNASYSRFHQEEFESSGTLGIEFGVLTYDAKAVAHTAPRGVLAKGAIGVWVEYRDYVAGGFSFTPATTEKTIAGFAYQDLHFGEVSLQLGLRYDLRQVRPSEEFSADIGDIRSRDFGDVSASVAVQVPLSTALTLEGTVMRSLRLPGIEELFSQGPHLAAYSFDIGNPDLDLEAALGGEIALRFRGKSVAASAAAFANQFSGYIFPLNTGELNYRIYLPIYQFSGSDARMVGAEGQVSWRISSRWSASTTASYVRGTLTDLDEPIPWTPPYRQSVELKYEKGSMTVGMSLRGSARQSRVGPFEQTTAGYLVPDAFLQYFFSAGGGLHTLTFGVDNVSNSSYRDHLSRVKSIMPEPGVNVRLVYRAFF